MNGSNSFPKRKIFCSLSIMAGNAIQISGVVAACLALATIARALGAPEADRVPDRAEPDYRAYFLKTLDGWLAQRAFANAGRPVAQGRFHPVAEAAACQVPASIFGLPGTVFLPKTVNH